MRHLLLPSVFKPRTFVDEKTKNKKKASGILRGFGGAFRKTEYHADLHLNERNGITPNKRNEGPDRTSDYIFENAFHEDEGISNCHDEEVSITDILLAYAREDYSNFNIDSDVRSMTQEKHLSDFCNESQITENDIYGQEDNDNVCLSDVLNSLAFDDAYQFETEDVSSVISRSTSRSLYDGSEVCRARESCFDSIPHNEILRTHQKGIKTNEPDSSIFSVKYTANISSVKYAVDSVTSRKVLVSGEDLVGSLPIISSTALQQKNIERLRGLIEHQKKDYERSVVSMIFESEEINNDISSIKSANHSEKTLRSEHSNEKRSKNSVYDTPLNLHDEHTTYYEENGESKSELKSIASTIYYSAKDFNFDSLSLKKRSTMICHLEDDFKCEVY